MHKQKGYKTQQKIYSAVKQLLTEKTANEISIQDICQYAGIGVGTFYHYYKSKTEAIFDISNPIDEYFETKVLPELDEKTGFDQLKFFFYHQALFMIQFVLANGLQETMNYVGADYQHFFSTERTTYQILLNIISDNNLYPNWSKKYSCQQITEHLLYLSRGDVMNWLGSDCSYNLIDNIWSHIEMTFPE